MEDILVALDLEEKRHSDPISNSALHTSGRVVILRLVHLGQIVMAEKKPHKK
jgi:hypothetical protein